MISSLLLVTVKADPVLPRWIDSSKHGYGYILTRVRDQKFDYAGYMEMSWDFDYNCFRTAFSSYSDQRWSEQSYCNGVSLDYSSWNGYCLREEENISVE